MREAPPYFFSLDAMKNEVTMLKKFFSEGVNVAYDSKYLLVNNFC